MARVATAAVLASVLLLAAACGDSEQEAYEKAFEEGYYAGQYDVCRELDKTAPRVKERLKHCFGL